MSIHTRIREIEELLANIKTGMDVQDRFIMGLSSQITKLEDADISPFNDLLIRNTIMKNAGRITTLEHLTEGMENLVAQINDHTRLLASISQKLRLDPNNEMTIEELENLVGRVTISPIPFPEEPDEPDEIDPAVNIELRIDFLRRWIAELQDEIVTLTKRLPKTGGGSETWVQQGIRARKDTIDHANRLIRKLQSDIDDQKLADILTKPHSSRPFEDLMDELDIE